MKKGQLIILWVGGLFYMNKLPVILVMLLVCVQDVRGQGDNASSRETLKGLNAIAVQVLSSESCAGRGYVGAVLQNEAELQLRMAGIKVFPSGATAQATLRVKLLCYELTGSIKGYFFNQQSEVVQWIEWPLLRPTKLVEVTTWSSFIALGIEVDNNAARVRDNIDGSIKQFLNAWLAVNR